MTVDIRPTVTSSSSLAALLAHVTNNGLITKEDRTRLETVWRSSDGETPPLKTISQLALMTDDQLLQAAHDVTNIPIATSLVPDSDLAQNLSIAYLRHAAILPLYTETGPQQFAIADPFNDHQLKSLKLATGSEITLYLATAASIDEALSTVEGDASSNTADTALETDLAFLKEQASEAPIIRLTTRLLETAVSKRATDIHIEPEQEGLTVRLRIDGRLTVDQPVKRDHRNAVISRLKLMAGLDIAEQRLPQDGRYQGIIRGRRIDMRVATLPTLSGETLVIRLLDASEVHLDLVKLGFGQEAIESLFSLTDSRGGLLLVTGPTGSGKTTTLHALLDRLNTPDTKIITVEDPVEYEREGLVQCQVKPSIGLDFAKVLRATLRHNPDILLVGEIRDSETAHVAIEAAMTGHLVLATLHTNNAASAAARLIDMGVEEYLLASTMIGVVAQRLVPMLCGACKVEQPLDLIPLTEKIRPWPVAFPETAPTTCYQPKGCKACNGTGYAGRTVVHEILKIDDQLRDMIRHKRDGAELRHYQLEAQIPSLRTTGLEKVIEGEIALDDMLLQTGLGDA